MLEGLSKEAEHQGGTVAGPYVAKILGEVLPYLGVASTANTKEEVKEEQKTEETKQEESKKEETKKDDTENKENTDEEIVEVPETKEFVQNILDFIEYRCKFFSINTCFIILSEQ